MSEPMEIDDVLADLHLDHQNANRAIFNLPRMEDENGNIKLTITKWQKKDQITNLFLKSSNKMTFKTLTGAKDLSEEEMSRYTININEEVKFCTPIPYQASVTKFHVDFLDLATDEKKFGITGKLKGKEEAEKVYEYKVKSGETAVYSAYDSHSQDHFVIRVGALPSNSYAQVTFEYIMDMKLAIPTYVERNGVKEQNHNQNLYRYHLPIVNKTRYRERFDQLNELKSKLDEPEYARFLNQFKLDFDFEIILQCNPRAKNVTGFMTQIVQNDPKPWQLTREKYGEIWKLDVEDLKNNPQDIELYVELLMKNVKEDSVSLSTVHFEVADDNTAYGAITWTPGRENEIQKAFKGAETMVDIDDFDDFDEQEGAEPIEIIAVIDRSGSMGGSYMTSAKETLKLIVQQLPQNCTFDIISFGSKWTSLFGDRSVKPMSYNANTVAQANKEIQNMDANYGGTDILEPMEAIYNTPLGKGISTRRIFLLTDGGVYNTERVILDAKNNAAKNRIYTFAIGNGASLSLTQGLADATHGMFTTILDNDRMQQKVMHMVTNSSIDPLILKNINFDLFDNIPGLKITGPGHSMQEYPNCEPYNRPPMEHREAGKIEKIEPKQQMRFYYKIEKELGGEHSLREYFNAYIGEESQISLIVGQEGRIEEQSLDVQDPIPLKFSFTEAQRTGDGLRLFYAMQQIQKTQNNYNTKQYAKEMSIEHGILSTTTAFVGFKSQNDKSAEMEELKNLRRIKKYPEHPRPAGKMHVGFGTPLLAGSAPRSSNGFDAPQKAGGCGFGPPQKCGGARRSPFGAPERCGSAKSYKMNMPAMPAGAARPHKKMGSDDRQFPAHSPPTFDSKGSFPVHIGFINLANFDGSWSDTDDKVFRELVNYNSGYTKDAIKKAFEGTKVKMCKATLTAFIASLFKIKCLPYKVEWQQMYGKSIQFVMKALKDKNKAKAVYAAAEKFLNDN